METCKHPKVRVVAREEDVEFVECQECGEVFDSDEFRDMEIEAKDAETAGPDADPETDPETNSDTNPDTRPETDSKADRAEKNAGPGATRVAR